MNIKSQVRLHLVVILSGVAVFGAVVNRLLLAQGLYSMVMRNLCVLTISYGAFFVFVSLWISYLKENPEMLQTTAAGAAAEQNERIAARAGGNKPGKWWDALDIPDAGEFTFILIGVLILLGVGIWIGVEGPMILIDAACEVGLSVGLISASRKAAGGDWREGVFKRTIIPFTIVLVVSTAILYGVQRHCPASHRLSEALHQCAASSQ